MSARYLKEEIMGDLENTNRKSKGTYDISCILHASYPYHLSVLLFFEGEGAM